MSDDTRFSAVHQEVNTAATMEDAPAAALELLDENEIVELSVKPSWWFIAFVSARFLGAAAVLGIAAAVVGGASATSPMTYVAALALLAAVLRVAVASLQWASRVYMLTNRRVMCFSGVLSVDVVDCGLAGVSRANMQLGGAQRVLRLGTIHMTPADQRQSPVVWEHVARAGDVYAKVIRAIKKAQSSR